MAAASAAAFEENRDSAAKAADADAADENKNASEGPLAFAPAFWERLVSVQQMDNLEYDVDSVVIIGQASLKWMRPRAVLKCDLKSQFAYPWDDKKVRTLPLLETLANLSPIIEIRAKQ